MILSNFSNLFNNLHFNEFHLYLITTFISLVLIVLQGVIYKKINIISILVYIAINACAILFSTVELKSTINVLITIGYFLVLIYILFDYLLTAKIYSIRKNKIQDYLKNSEFEYYIQINKKNKVIDYSLNLLSLTNRNNEGMYNLKFPELIFPQLYT